MAGGSGGSGGSGGVGGARGVMAALAALGAAGLIGWMIWGGAGGGGNGGGPTPTQQAQLPPTVPSAPTAADAQPTTTTVYGPAAFDREKLREGHPDAVILTITAFGLPARIGAEIADADNQKLDSGQVKTCTPDEIYPDPCVWYWVVKRGTAVAVSAGDSRAGYWPDLDFVQGPGCNLKGGSGVDQSCALTLESDVDLTAVYFGSESPGLAHYQYPTCPTQRSRPPAWASRCR